MDVEKVLAAAQESLALYKKATQQLQETRIELEESIAKLVEMKAAVEASLAGMPADASDIKTEVEVVELKAAEEIEETNEEPVAEVVESPVRKARSRKKVEPTPVVKEEVLVLDDEPEVVIEEETEEEVFALEEEPVVFSLDDDDDDDLGFADDEDYDSTDDIDKVPF